MQSPWLGLAPGDATLAIRFALTALASLGVSLAVAQTAREMWVAWICAVSPALLFVPGFPALLAPFGLIPLYFAALRARSGRDAALLGACAATGVVIGASGWIFHYFDRPLVPALIAMAIGSALWAPLLWATRALVCRSRLWIPPAAALIPLTEVIRGEWMNPPLPGLLIAQANADNALIRLAPWIGEAGIGYLVALIGLAGGAALAAPVRSRALALVVAAVATLAALPPGQDAPPLGEQIRICAIADPLRGRGREPFGGAREAAVFALADRAQELGCAIAAFPEYSLRLSSQQIVPDGWGVERLAGDMVAIGGAGIVSRAYGPSSHRNVVCRLHLGPGRQINCAGAYDKLVPAPFGEVDLFRGVPALARLGARISRHATGAKHTRVTSVEPVGTLAIGAGRRAGVAICWEILVPGIFGRRGAQRGSVDLLAVVSDLDGFGGSRAAIDHLRKAASLHAVSLAAPLLFASTHDPFLVAANGRVVAPVHRDSFVTVWEIRW